MNQIFAARNVLVALSALLMTASGVMDLIQPKPLVDGFGAIGLPMTVATVVGVGKLAGVLALGVTSFVPAAPRWLREWAWAGFCIDLAGPATAEVPPPSSRIPVQTDHPRRRGTPPPRSPRSSAPAR